MPAFYSWESRGRGRGGAGFGAGGGGITVVLALTQQGASAPSGFIVEAIDTTNLLGLDSFGELYYTWSISGGISGTFVSTGRTKTGRIGGPVWSGALETAGVYLITCDVSDNAGHSGSAGIFVTVNNPDVEFAGAATICVDTTGGSVNWGPGGAANTYRTTWPTFASDTQVIVRDGSSGLGGLSFNNLSNIIIKQSGSGTMPSVGDISFGTNSGVSPYGNAQPTNIRVVGLDCASLHAGYVQSYCMYHRMNVRTYSGDQFSFGWGGYVGMLYSEIDIQAGSGAVYGAWAGPHYKSSMIGVRVIGACSLHNIRTRGWSRSLVANNFVSGLGRSDLHGMKMHSNGTLNTYTDVATADNGGGHPPGWEQRWLVVAENKCGQPSPASTVGWMMTVDPENNDYDEGNSDVVIENNEFPNYTGIGTNLVMGGRRYWYRGNYRSGGGSFNSLTNINTTTGGAHSGQFVTDYGSGPYHDQGNL